MIESSLKTYLSHSSPWIPDSSPDGDALSSSPEAPDKTGDESSLFVAPSQPVGSFTRPLEPGVIKTMLYFMNDIK